MSTDDIVRRMQESAIADQETKAAFFHEALVVSSPRPYVPEQLFVNYFLPYFSGQIPASSANPFFAQWVGIAGTPMTEVDVIDHQGRILFTVPALFNTSFISPERNGRSYSNIMLEYELRSTHIPVAATNFLANSLDGKFGDTVNQPGASPEQTDRWLTIFARYGIAPPKGAALAKDNQFFPQDEDFIY